MVGNTEAYKCVTGNVIKACGGLRACNHLHNLSTSNCGRWPSYRKNGSAKRNVLTGCCLHAVLLLSKSVTALRNLDY
ncbi:hypothetical protein L2E82_18052 [Cichorium intybus]|uniref:Uncharacterized protein n=1 Tax=Cichorium intybus TaxID=13427 RepID=A0ACB9F978_CICIN|nr:hypothetical protein L2E82_18052 [Cichorium intybus]